MVIKLTSCGNTARVLNFFFLSLILLWNLKIHNKDKRTTYATKLRESDIPAEMIKKWLGHSSYSITEKYYIKLSESFENKEIEKLNQI